MVIFESLILTISGFIIGLLFSRFGIMFVSFLIDKNMNYNLDTIEILNQEFWLFGLCLLIGLISSIIPALQVYKLNISKILADE